MSKISHPPRWWDPMSRSRRRRTQSYEWALGTCQVWFLLRARPPSLRQRWCRSSETGQVCQVLLHPKIGTSTAERWKCLSWERWPLPTHQSTTVRTLVARAHETDRLLRGWDTSSNQGPVDSVVDLGMAGLSACTSATRKPGDCP